MKTKITLFIALFISVAAFARNEAVLTITMVNGNNTSVSVNGKVYRLVNNSLVLRDLRPGNYAIRIFRTVAVRNQQGRNFPNRSKQEVLYSSNVRLKSDYHVDVMVNRFGKAMLDERPLRNNGYYETNGYGYDDDHDYYGGQSQGGYYSAISNTDLDRLISSIKSQGFSDQKKIVARAGINRNYFNTSQVVQLLKLFSFESDRLEMARLLYTKTLDRNNFYLVYNEFHFSSSREELERFTGALR